jgi:hypothetical protein
MEEEQRIQKQAQAWSNLKVNGSYLPEQEVKQEISM